LILRKRVAANRVQISQCYARMTGRRTTSLVSYVNLQRIRRPPLSTIK